jgi:hypothetical protein
MCFSWSKSDHFSSPTNSFSISWLSLIRIITQPNETSY